jgi:hypothetical protein
MFIGSDIKTKQTPWSESASKLYRLSDRHLLAKLVPTFVDKGCHVVIMTDPYGCILNFLDRLDQILKLQFTGKVRRRIVRK